MRPRAGTFTNIDLAICHPAILLDYYGWTVSDDLSGSHHYPIFLRNIGRSIDDITAVWELCMADYWDSLHVLAAVSQSSFRYMEIRNFEEAHVGHLYRKYWNIKQLFNINYQILCKFLD